MEEDAVELPPSLPPAVSLPGAADAMAPEAREAEVAALPASLTPDEAEVAEERAGCEPDPWRDRALVAYLASGSHDERAVAAERERV
jgi:hypothetical protein